MEGEFVEERALALIGVVTDGTAEGLVNNGTWKKIKNDPINSMMFEVIKDLIGRIDVLQKDGE